MGALILAIIAGVVPVFPFSTEETAYAQEATRPDDATLSSLSLEGATLSPDTFAAGTTEYTARVENSVNVVTVMAVTNNPDANYNIRPGDADRSLEGDQVSLQSGRNTRITLTVTAEDRRTRQTYTIMVYRDRSTLSANANLSALSLDGVRLSPGFSSGTLAYNARVRYDVTTVTVAATAADIGALVPVVTGGAEDVANNVVTLNGVDMNTVITVTVTAEDDMATKPYMITVFRESGPVLSDVAMLSALTLTGGTLSPPFAPGMTEYTSRVGNENESVTVAATAAGAPGATVKIMPADQDTSDPEDTDHQVYLTPGTNTPITVTVTAENGSTNTYTITAYHERGTQSDNANLSALSLDGVSLSPAFDPEKTAYDARVGYDVTTVTVAATAADIGALVPVVTGGAEDVANNVVTLNGVGTNTPITVTVTPESGMADDKPYIITVYRESGPVLSDVATLSALTLTAAAAATLSPEFADDTTEYTASVENDDEFVTVEATPTDDPGAMVNIMPADQNSLPLPAGHQVYLTAGARTAIIVTVTAENGSTNTYTVMAYRKRATESTDSTLSALSLDGVNLSPTFDPEKTAYDARVRYDVSEVTVAATVADIAASAVVEVDSVVGASVANNKVVTLGTEQGANTVITVTVTGEDGMATPYMITVYRENIVLSDIATLSSLSLGEDVALAVDFEPGMTEYTARAGNGFDFVTVEATPEDDAGAMAAIMPADQNSLPLPAGHQVYLTVGEKTAITVTVTAENGSTNTYTVMVYRLRDPASTDATLSALNLSGAVLSPVFDPERDTYTATATNSTDITTVTAPASDIGAMVPMIMPGDSDLVTAGHQVVLSDRGATRIMIEVTAEDGTAMESYEIIVYRDAEVGSDATLQSLTLSGITLMPAFDPATTAYTAEVEDIESTTVEAVAAHPGATVEGAVERSLTVGENVIMVTVTAEDDTSQTYTVTVTVLGGDTQDLLEIYDINDNDQIDKDEVLTAIDDYLFEETISREQVLDIINLYLFREA